MIVTIYKSIKYIKRKANLIIYCLGQQHFGNRINIELIRNIDDKAN